MAPDRATELFFELFSGLPRQGPGTTASTLRALSLVPGVGPGTRVLDVGCGTGAQTLVLAHGSPARIVAVDNHPPFIDALNREARRLGITDRLEARVADMRSLDFADGSFDLIWCEGAIYNVGVEAGLRDWRRLLPRNGHVALSEACWRKPDPPRRMRSVLEPRVPGDPRHVGAPGSRRGVRLRDRGPLSAPRGGVVGRLLQAPAGQRDRIPTASSRRAGCTRAGGAVPARDRHLACLLGVLRLRVPGAACPLRDRYEPRRGQAASMSAVPKQPGTGSRSPCT